MKKSVQYAKISHVALLCLIGMAGLAAAQSARYAVQLEAAPTPDAAQERVRQLKAKGVDAYIVKSQIPGKGTFYRVRAGNFPGQAEARRYGSDLQAKGVVSEFFIAVYEKPVAEAAPPIVANNRQVKPSAVTTVPAAIETPKQSTPTEIKEPKNTLKEQQVSKPAPTIAANSGAPKASPPANVAANQTVKPEVSEPVTAVSRSVMSSPPPSGNNGANAAANNPVASTPTSAPITEPGVSFVKFQDTTIGYSFERPQNWEGGPLDQKDAQDQKVNAGALFKSSQDSAFIHAIWNNLDKANSPDNDNDLIVELILRSMGSGDGTQQMSETARKVVSENGYIKTYLDLRASFKVQGQEGTFDCLGKAVIVRASKGILLIVAFYSKSGPPHVANMAERIVASAQPPQ